MHDDSRRCSIEGCGGVHYGRGWCRNHYIAWREHGDPLTYKGTRKGEPLRYFHEVVMAYEGDECQPWPYSCSHDYGTVYSGGKRWLVPRLICTIVEGPAPSPEHEAAHSCGNGHKRCCTKRHLSWKTRSGNTMDSIVHGTHNRAKLTWDDVRTIRAIGQSMPKKDVGRLFGVGRKTIANILNNQIWPV